MTENMEIWEQVEKTDPEATKHVNARGGFTAIAAYSQIKKATEIFGPVGQGWGWEVSEPIFPPNDTVIFKVILWHGNREQTVTQFGQKKLNDSKGPDEDAFKKATTDGITKCLSYLGFNADVFLGKFDDNKYVEERKEEKSLKSVADNMVYALVNTTTLSAFEGITKSDKFKTDYTTLTPEFRKIVDKAAMPQKEALQKQEKSPFEKDVA